MKLSRAPVLQVRVGESQVHAEVIRAGAAIWAGEASYESPEDLTEVLARLAAAPAERCRRLQITLERPPAQMRTLTDLPPVRDRELSSLVANQAGRFFRRNGATLITDAAWVSNGNGKSQRVSQAAAVEEPLVLAIVAGAAQAGLIVESITPAGASAPLQLFPAAARAIRERARLRSVLWLGAAAAAVWVLTTVAFGARVIFERRSIDQELAAAQAPLAALREVRLEMRTAESMIRELAEARQTRGQALATLARLNAALPDSAVLTAYTWRSDGSGIAAGAGRQASDVLASVERRHALTHARLEGAIVREVLAGREWERFTMLFGERSP